MKFKMSMTIILIALLLHSKGISREEINLSNLLPNGAEIEALNFYDQAGNQIFSQPAVIANDLNNDGREYLIIGFSLNSDEPEKRELFIKIFRPINGQQYQSIFEFKAPGKFFFSPGLKAFDLNGDGRKEVILVTSNSASLGGILDVFAIQNNHVQRVFTTSGFHRLSFIDLKGDGSYEIIAAAKYSGDIMAPSNIYSWDGTRYSLANLEFPRYFQAEVQKYIDLVNSLPKGSLDRLNYMLFIAEEYGNTGRVNDGIFQAQAVISEAQDLLREPGVDPREKNYTRVL